MSTATVAQPGSPEALGMSPEAHGQMVDHLMALEIGAGDNDAARARVSAIEDGLKDGSMTPQEIPVTLDRRKVREYISDKANGARSISRKGVATVLAVTVGFGAVGGPVAAIAKETGTTPAAATATQTTETTATSTTPTQTTETTSTSTTPTSTVESGAEASEEATASEAADAEKNQKAFDESVKNFVSAIEELDKAGDFAGDQPSDKEQKALDEAANNFESVKSAMVDATKAKGVDQDAAKLVDNYVNADTENKKAYEGDDKNAQGAADKKLSEAENALTDYAAKLESDDTGEAEQSEDQESKDKSKTIEKKDAKQLLAEFTAANDEYVEAVVSGDQDKIDAAKKKRDQAGVALAASINNAPPKGGSGGNGGESKTKRYQPNANTVSGATHHIKTGKAKDFRHFVKYVKGHEDKFDDLAVSHKDGAYSFMRDFGKDMKLSDVREGVLLSALNSESFREGYYQKMHGNKSTSHTNVSPDKQMDFIYKVLTDPDTKYKSTKINDVIANGGIHQGGDRFTHGQFINAHSTTITGKQIKGEVEVKEGSIAGGDDDCLNLHDKVAKVVAKAIGSSSAQPGTPSGGEGGGNPSNPNNPAGGNPSNPNNPTGGGENNKDNCKPGYIEYQNRCVHKPQDGPPPEASQEPHRETATPTPGYRPGHAEEVDQTQHGDPTNLQPTPNGTEAPNGAPAGGVTQQPGQEAPNNPQHQQGSATEGTTGGTKAPENTEATGSTSGAGTDPQAP